MKSGNRRPIVFTATIDGDNQSTPEKKLPNSVSERPRERFGPNGHQCYLASRSRRPRTCSGQETWQVFLPTGVTRHNTY